MCEPSPPRDKNTHCPSGGGLPSPLSLCVCVSFQEELQRWSQAMQRAVQPLAAEEASGSSGAKTHSLPPPSSSAALPEPSAAKKEKKFGLAGKKK